MYFKVFVDSPFYLAFMAYDIAASCKYSFSLGEIKMLRVESLGCFMLSYWEWRQLTTWEQVGEAHFLDPGDRADGSHSAATLGARPL